MASPYRPGREQHGSGRLAASAQSGPPPRGVFHPVTGAGPSSSAQFPDGPDVLGQSQLPIADPVETLLDLYELRLTEQAEHFVTAVRERKLAL